MAERSTITHLEIRRVQNGFVVMGLNFAIQNADVHYSSDYRSPQRASFVAQDVDALKAVIESLVTGAEMEWLPTVDVPLVDMVRHHTQTDSDGMLGKIATRIEDLAKVVGA